jgi:hypothetical protein
VIGTHSTILRRRVVRPDDLLALDLTFDNLGLTSGPAPRLVRVRAGRPSHIIVRLQGQAVGEQDFLEETEGGGPETAPNIVQARLAGPSRLSFRMPADAGGLDFNLDTVLDACRRWPMALSALARPDRPILTPGILVDTGIVAAMSADAAAATAVADALSPIADGVSEAMTEAGSGLLADRVRGAARRVGTAAAAGISRAAAPASSLAADTAFYRAVRGARESDETTIKAARVLFDAELGAATARAARPGPGQASTNVAANVAETLAELGVLIQLALRPHLPSATVTAIEAPYRLFLTPLASSAWAHALRPVERGGRVELWHTRMARRVGGVADENVKGAGWLRAVWSHDYDPGKVGDNYTAPGTSLSKTTPEPRDRDEVVRLTSGYNERDGTVAYDPRSVPADRVMLSTLGASLDLEGKWSRLPDFVNVSAWKHISSYARDSYVRVVREGFLMPFGQRAAQIIVSERKFENAAAGGRIALLRKRIFIVVRERLRSFPVPGQSAGGRGFPFDEVEILTQVTPPIFEGAMNPAPGQGEPNPVTGDAFVPRRGGQDYLFEVRATDGGGQPVTVAMPLTFVLTGANQSSAKSGEIVDAYNLDKPLQEERRTMSIGGASIQYAPVEDPAAGADVVLPTNEIEVRAELRTSAFDKSRPRFAPVFGTVEVEVTAVKKLADKGGFQKAALASQYLSNGFGGGNPAKLFLGLIDTFPLQFGAGGASSENTGGFFEPNMGVEALSALKGAVADAAQVANNQFRPDNFFGDAKLLGSILIKDLLQGVVTAVVGDDAPEFVNVDVDADPPYTEARLCWSTQVTRSLPLFKPGAGGNTSMLDLNVRSRVPFNGDPPETTIATTLTNFKIDMFGLIILWFDKFEYKKEPDKKPDVNPDLHPQDAVVFGGPLEFVNKLSDLIPDGAFSDPPVLDISPTGIVAGYELEIPDVQVGVLLMSNMTLGARLRLPFDGDPVSTRFNFAEREDPFNITVSLLGGGGFFAIALDSGGVREVEAALEAGAAIAFDIGVASGGLYAKIGFYFNYKNEAGGETIEFTGYVEMGGELSVLGLITVSITFHLSLSYHKTTGMSELRGQAKLIVEIEILFFSTSVTLKVERRFAGSDADPKFLDFIPDQATWDRYAAAFA